MAACLGSFSAVSAVLAAGLQVSPVSLSISERSGVIRLHNTTSEPLRAQVRVYRWTQADAEDRLEATDNLLASPPFLDIAPYDGQVVRLVRREMGDPATEPCEIAYRLRVDELPRPATEALPGLRYRLSYSVPVFVTAERCRDAEPRLSWQFESDGGRAVLVVTNSGSRTAQLAGAAIVGPDGQRETLNPGLIGYVLPGSRMVFAVGRGLRIPADGASFEVMVNGNKVERTWPLAAADR